MDVNIDNALNERNNGFNSPSPCDISKARISASLSTKAAASLVYCAARTWQQWERGDRNMPYGLWELFNIKLMDAKNNANQKDM